MKWLSRVRAVCCPVKRLRRLQLNLRTTPGEGAPLILMARAASFLYGAGAALVLATVIMPHAPGMNQPMVLTLVLIAAVTAIALPPLAHRIPPPLFQLIVPLGCVLITGAMIFAPSQAPSYAMLYIWAALFLFSFFSGFQAAWQLAFLGGSVTMYMFQFSHSPDTYPFWLMTLGAAAVAGLFMHGQMSQVRSLAHLDPLTGASNRRSWEYEPPKALAVAERSGEQMSVAILDLDRFKQFNDQYGHPAGDRLLRDAVQIWGTNLRSGDTLARYGGEEFALLLPGCDTPAAMEKVEQLRRLVPSGTTASAGIATWDGAESALALVARADAGLYEAKRLGRNCAVVAPLSESAAEGPLGQTSRWAERVYRTLSEHRLDAAAPLAPAYQPVVRLSDRQIVGAEALFRLPASDPDTSVEGLFYAAQRIGLVRELDWLARRAAVQGARDFPAGAPLFVNVSVASLLDPLHDVDQTLLLLRWAGRAPADVVFEITERESISELARLVDVLAQYREAGLRFAIDDVGEGHSTMEVLAAAVPEYIKIARRLVRAMGERGSRSAVAAAVAFARSCGSTVIAEGIETESDAERAILMGVELGQGYGLGRPVAAATFAAALVRQNRDPSGFHLQTG
ncbi:MAG: EAL domain-containing protein [Candidatus Dormibacteria bacterium]